MSHAIDLSIVVPAYNEAARLPAYLAEVVPYVACAQGAAEQATELIVVDDGSRDATADVVASAAADLGRSCEAEWSRDLVCLTPAPLAGGGGERGFRAVAIRVIRHERNLGKGAAVCTGMLAARGRLRLFADADGATPIQEEARLRRAIDAGAHVAIGSRALRDPSVTRETHAHRVVVGRVFANLVRYGLRLPIADTQCGFKMFRAEAAERLFRKLREPGYLFDVELLLWAQRLGLRIAEVPVNWHDMPGSKVQVLRDGCRMLRGLVRLWRQHRQEKRHGVWATAVQGRQECLSHLG